ncbi:cuticle protein 76-like [Cephus cinctus]|uniref:Cuticle protein 76-like n=1 Tax=Cephus cinctus TaxID=211228 RepID=A0AAJ7BQM0_CEPCN|nr:cuticle protein 76-like [Cephus cinctus]
MAAKLFIFAVAIAAVNAGYLGSPSAHYVTGQVQVQPHVYTSTSDNILRSHGNLAQIATQSKTIEAPHSSVSKSDIRVSNPGVYSHAVPVGYAAPAPHGALFAPGASGYPHAPANYAAAPVSYGHAAAPASYAPATATYSHAPAAYAHAPVTASYAPAIASHAPVVASHAPVVANYAHAPAAHQSLLGVAYSPASEVAHLSYSNVNDHFNYAW